MLAVLATWLSFLHFDYKRFQFVEIFVLQLEVWNHFLNALGISFKLKFTTRNLHFKRYMQNYFYDLKIRVESLFVNSFLAEDKLNKVELCGWADK